MRSALPSPEYRVPDKEIRTSNFSIYPQQDCSQGRLPHILGYQVSNSITVTREKVADAGRLLQAALMISEGMQQGYPPPEPRFMAKAAAMSTEAVSDVPVEQGSEEVSYTVSVVFELR